MMAHFVPGHFCAFMKGRRFKVIRAFAVGLTLIAGSTSFAQDVVESEKSQRKVLTVIVDHSGSMSGERLEWSKRSTITVIDLLSIWSKVFPDAAGQLQFQYVQFGGTGDYEAIHRLGSITDPGRLRDVVATSLADYRSTDYAAGINPSTRAIEAGGPADARTLVITDGEDHGAGPTPGQNYRALGRTTFVLLGPKSVPLRWMKSIPEAAEMRPSSSADVTFAFIETLLSLLDDPTRYLIRRGERRLDPAGGFTLNKHGQKSLSVVIPRASGHSRLSAAGGPSGVSGSSVVESAMFFHVAIPAAAPAGDYRFVLQDGGGTPVDYISFEECRIGLGVSTTPRMKAGECAIAGSAVTFQPLFIDLDRREPITAPDFVRLTSSRQEIRGAGGGRAVAKKESIAGAPFTASFSIADGDQYEVWSAWTYRQSSFARPLQKTAPFCLTPRGLLVRLAFDSGQAWEGRDVEFIARVASLKAEAPAHLPLQTGQGVLRLEKDAGDTYRGTLVAARPGRFPLSLINEDPATTLALDAESPAVLAIAPRRIRVRRLARQELDPAVLEQDWLGGIGVAIESLRGRVLKRNIPAADLPDAVEQVQIPVLLRYIDGETVSLDFEVSVNRLFPGETARIVIDAFATGEKVLPGEAGHVRINTRMVGEERVVLTGPESHGRCALRVAKSPGPIEIVDPLRPEPGFKISGLVGRNGSSPIVLPARSITLQVRTNRADVRLEQVIRVGLLTLLTIVIVLLLAAIVIAILVKRGRFVRKLAVWQNDCKGLSPEDFASSFPRRVRARVARLHDSVSDASPAPPVPAIVRERRAFKTLLENQRREAFDRLVAKSCSMKFLRDLATSLRSPNVDDVEWWFQTGTDRLVVRIGSFEQSSEEQVIRTRITVEHDFGAFVLHEGRVWYRAGSNIAYVRRESGDMERLEPGDQAPLHSGEVVAFGPLQNESYFFGSVLIAPGEARIRMSRGKE